MFEGTGYTLFFSSKNLKPSTAALLVCLHFGATEPVDAHMVAYTYVYLLGSPKSCGIGGIS